MIKTKLIKEELITPDFKKLKEDYKIPSQYIDDSFGFYNITLECEDLGQLRTALWFIPVEMLTRDQNANILTNSYRNVPDGKCLPDSIQFIWNNAMMSLPDKKSGNVNIKLKNFNKEKEIIQYPIIYNKQLLGFLKPNSQIDDTFIIQQQQNAGVHLTYGFNRRVVKDPEHQVMIFSLIPWKEIEPKLKKVFDEYDIKMMNEKQIEIKK